MGQGDDGVQESDEGQEVMPKKRGRVGGRQASAPVKRHQRKNVRPSVSSEVRRGMERAVRKSPELANDPIVSRSQKGSDGDRDRKRVNETRQPDKGLSLAPSPLPDVELWAPPERPKKPVRGNRFTARPLFLKDEANEPTEGSGVTTRYVNHPEVPTDDLFIAPSQSKLTNRELGFDAKGRCLYGCDGTRSIKKGYTNIAMHHYRCPFWETVDGQSKTPF